eukprot:1160436-Pelagomonas_calceolata.AAC.7
MQISTQAAAINTWCAFSLFVCPLLAVLEPRHTRLPSSDLVTCNTEVLGLLSYMPGCRALKKVRGKWGSNAGPIGLWQSPAKSCRFFSRSLDLPENVPQSQVDAAALEVARARSALEAAEQQLARQRQTMAQHSADMEAAQAQEAAAKARVLDLQVCIPGVRASRCGCGCGYGCSRAQHSTEMEAAQCLVILMKKGYVGTLGSCQRALPKSAGVCLTV